MFKTNRLLPSAAATLLIVSACTAPDANLISKTNQVIENTKTTCSFAPTVASIAALLGLPGAPTAATVAAQVCAEVEKLPTVESGGAQNVVVSIDGQPVEGVLF